MHWPQFWCKNYVRFAFIFHLFCWEFMISYILVSSTISVSDDVRFVHHKCDGPTGTGVIYSSALRGFTPCFMVSVVQFLVFFASFCWPVFYGECCSVFSIFGQFLLTSVFAYFLLAIALSCLTSICVFWLLLRYLQNFPVN
jgi:hypothetical protein